MMPGCVSAAIPVINKTRLLYICANPSEACPDGCGQEDTIKKLLAEKYEKKPFAAQVSEKRKTGEQLGFAPADGGIAERLFTKAESYIISNYTNGYIHDVFEKYGGWSTDRNKEVSLLPKAAHITADGLYLDGPTCDVRSFPEISGGKLTVYMKLRIGKSAWNDSFDLIGKFAYGRSGYYIKYYKAENSLYAEIFDGDMSERKKVHFPIPQDERFHSLCFTADGKNLTAYFDGMQCGRIKAGEIVPDPRNLTLFGGIDGLLSDIKIFNYAVSPQDAEILTKQCL